MIPARIRQSLPCLTYVLIYHLSVVSAASKVQAKARYRHWLKPHILQLLSIICVSNTAAKNQEEEEEMSKPYSIKDPTVAPLVRAAGIAFSPPTSGLLGAAVGSRAGPLIIDRFVPGHRGSWLTIIGSSAVGFGVGYSSVSALHWLRLRLIKALLEYRGWMENPTSTATKVCTHGEGRTTVRLGACHPHRPDVCIPLQESTAQCPMSDSTHWDSVLCLAVLTGIVSNVLKYSVE